MSSPAEPADAAAIPLDAALLRAWPMPVRQGGDKFARGTAVVVGGSPRTPGAVLLAGEAALRMGAGRLQIATASEVAVTVGVAVPEALVASLEADDDGGLLWSDETHLATMLQEAQAVLIGPGMLNETCAEVVGRVLRCINDEALVVLDARALCSLTDIADEVIPRGRLVLTPNRQELRTLAGCDDEPGRRRRRDPGVGRGQAIRRGRFVLRPRDVAGTRVDDGRRLTRTRNLGIGRRAGRAGRRSGRPVWRCGTGNVLGDCRPHGIGSQPRATVRRIEFPRS